MTGFEGVLKSIRRKAYLVVTSEEFINFIMVIVIFNIIVISMENLVNEMLLAEFNLFFNYVFIAEMTIKITAMG